MPTNRLTVVCPFAKVTAVPLLIVVFAEVVEVDVPMAGLAGVRVGRTAQHQRAAADLGQVSIAGDGAGDRQLADGGVDRGRAGKGNGA